MFDRLERFLSPAQCDEETSRKAGWVGAGMINRYEELLGRLGAGSRDAGWPSSFDDTWEGLAAKKKHETVLKDIMEV
jgi:hypothetical protein